MKAITLHQPYASLIALGVKQIETRGWKTSHRGPLAIHAGMHRPPMMHLPETRFTRDPAKQAEVDEHNGRTWFVCDTITDPAHQRPHRTDIRDRVPLRSTSPTLFFPHRGPWGGRPRNEQGGAADPNQPVTLVLPLGAVVATCTLVDCVPMIDALAPAPDGPDGPLVLLSGLNRHLWLYDTEPHDIEHERPYGDYRDGRWAWILEDVTRLPEPIPARGRQQLWDWEPDHAPAS